MTNTIKQHEFPAILKISFYKLVETFQELTNDPDPNISAYATQLIHEVEKYPELIDGFDDFSKLEKHKGIIHKLLRNLFPETLQSNEIKGVIPPFHFEPFYLSKRFKDILEDSDGYSFYLEGFNEKSMYIYGCLTIIANYYNYEVSFGMPTTVDIPSKSTNSVRTYRMAFNADMMEVFPTERAKEITPDDYQRLLENYDDLALWKEMFPPNSWVMRGIGIANFMDVTIDRAINQINSNILIKSEKSFERVQEEMRVLFNGPKLEVAFVPYDNDLMYAPVPKPEFKSIILGKEQVVNCSDAMCNYSYKALVENKEPLIVADTGKFNEMSQSKLSNRILEEGVGSFIVHPILEEGQLIGFIELTSPYPYKLNGGSIKKLNAVLPTIGIAAGRFKREYQNLREAIIQQECTTIHPSVKWRFEEEADRYIAGATKNEDQVFKDIIFKDVFPLYGQVDIKGSSTNRNDSVKNDLLKQLRGIDGILKKAFKSESLPVYEELLYRVGSLKKEISSGLLSGSEQKVISLLKTEIYPVFEHLKEKKALLKPIEKYFESLDPELGTIYELRKDFDDSVNRINHVLTDVLDKEQEAAQKMFPHYFERFKTDGVEFDMYIGQSISSQMNYDPIYLKNLRLWQLMTIYKMEKKYHDFRSNLNTDLDVTSLILVYNSSLSVHFRTDEKRFDVEGAYNARYEIVKKRVDKATVKGTPERITQPGKLAIIYASDSDAEEYRKYLSYLESKGYFKEGSLENLTLEDLQGISGLRALRVAYNFENIEDKKGELSVEKLLESMNG